MNEATGGATHKDNFHADGYDFDVFRRELVSALQKDPHFSQSTIPGAVNLLGRISRDSRVRDVRWAAYMMATASWETTAPTPTEFQRKDGTRVVQYPWLMRIAPIDEVGKGKGRRYFEPVKVEKRSDGSALLTEQDGDQWTISTTGVIMPLEKTATRGSTSHGPVSATYVSAPGTELRYYGRGYCQLTWWDNYVKAGIRLGRGLEFLFNPEAVKSDANSYEIMANGLINGKLFGNYKAMKAYFHDGHTDYLGARRMVNGQKHAGEIAERARTLEAILRKARLPGPSREGAPKRPQPPKPAPISLRLS